MPKLDQQISTLQERLIQLKLRRQRGDARQRAREMQRERRAETRRSFLLGALVLAKMRAGEIDPARLREWLDQSLARPDDRALFDLPPRSNSNGTAAGQSDAAPGDAQLAPGIEGENGHRVR